MNLTLLNIKLKSSRRAASSPHSCSTCLSCHLQENRPKGTSVLQLTVTDRDASHNGPPFTFTIVDGNEGNAFHISQQGALVTVGALNRKSKEHYLLQAQVSHSSEEKAVLRGCIDLTVRPEQPDLFVFPLFRLCTFSLSCLIVTVSFFFLFTFLATVHTNKTVN